MRPTVLLFDIDGTILSTGGAGRLAVENAFERRYRRRDACRGFSFAGMTDRAIARRCLEALGFAATAEALEREIDALLDDYLGELGAAVASAEDYRVHEGIEEAVLRGLARTACAVGLGTGNIERGARIKLDRAGLSERFAFGGFGSDHEERAELLRVGAERGAARLGTPRDRCRVVVIGDTPRDVAAARAIGAEAVAVATGPFSCEALSACGPGRVCATLAEAGVLDWLLA